MDSKTLPPSDNREGANPDSSSIDGKVLMTDGDDNNDISPDGSEEHVSDDAPTVPETRAGNDHSRRLRNYDRLGDFRPP